MRTRIETTLLPPTPTSYRSWSVTGPADPAACATGLAAARLFDQCVLYERDGAWWYAGGALCGVTLHRDRMVLHYGDRQTNRPVTHSPVVELSQLAATFPVDDWRAYGWVAFEFATDVGPGGLSTGWHPGQGVGEGGDAAGRAVRHRTAAPLAQLIVPEVEIRITPRRLDVRGTDEATVARVLAAVERLPADGPGGGERHQPGPLDVVTPGADAYQQAVATAVERIQAGRLAKVVLSRRVPVPFEVDLAATCLRGRRANSPARTFLVDLPGMRAVGFSPETVAEIGADGEVSSQPLAGTRPLGRGVEQDALARAELWSDAKEVFEHAVSVRAVTDDLAGICAPDSVVVRRFMDVEARGSVQHLASRVAGRLRPDVTNWEALAALSPAITASGIPRRVAYQTVAELEPTGRGLYAGAVVQVGQDGFLDAALALRCLHTHGGRTWLQAGAGVVADSRPLREYAETCEKFASIAPHLVPAHRRQ